MAEFHRTEPAPRDGDVVITRVTHSAPVWVLSVWPGTGQILCRAYEEALTRARLFARHSGVDVFVNDDGEPTFAIIGRFRK